MTDKYTIYELIDVDHVVAMKLAIKLEDVGVFDLIKKVNVDSFMAGNVEYVVENASVNMLKHLISDKLVDEYMFESCKQERLEVVKMLVSEYDVEKTDRYSIIAVLNLHKDVYDYLVSKDLAVPFESNLGTSDPIKYTCIIDCIAKSKSVDDKKMLEIFQAFDYQPDSEYIFKTMCFINYTESAKWHFENSLMKNDPSRAAHKAIECKNLLILKWLSDNNSLNMTWDICRMYVSAPLELAKSIQKICKFVDATLHFYRGHAYVICTKCVDGPINTIKYKDRYIYLPVHVTKGIVTNNQNWKNNARNKIVQDSIAKKAKLIIDIRTRSLSEDDKKIVAKKSLAKLAVIMQNLSACV